MVWLDFEATGLMNNPNTVPLEGAAIITDGNLNELAVLEGIVIHATEDELSHMGAFVLKMHTDTGLLDKVRDSSVTLDEFDTALREFAAPYFPAKGKPLADGTNYRGIAIGGNSVKFDFDVIEKFFPQTRATMDYRVIDISSTGELVLRWSPKAWAEMPPKASDHTALTDIREGTALLPPGPGPDGVALMTEGLFPLTVAGDGFYNAYISLEPGPHMRFPRFDRDERIQGAATLKGAELEGGLRDGRSIFELNSYTLEDVIESHGDRCLLASLEFLSVTMSSEKGGRLYLKGLLGGAETYSQDVHDRIAAGTALEEIPEMAGDFGGIRYLPPRHAPLQEYFCWEATIRLVPRNS